MLGFIWAVYAVKAVQRTGLLRPECRCATRSLVSLAHPDAGVFRVRRQQRV